MTDFLCSEISLRIYEYIVAFNHIVQNCRTNHFATLLSVYTAIQGIIDATHQQLEEIENTCAENNKVRIKFNANNHMFNFASSISGSSR